ncbi:MAG: LON peptidase substrate-binding domain-containing protein [Pseudomonadota bacterium]
MSHYPESLPLFPLNTVLFPGGRLKLRIFEPRYTDLISRSMRHGGGFGICPIDRGSELEPTSICPVGTLARIVDFETLEDGLLGIVVQGDRRFDIGEQWRGEDQLLHAEVEWQPTPGDFPVEERWQGLVSLLEQLWPEMQREYGYGPWPEEVGSYWLMGRLAEVLPAEPEQRTELLACDDPEEGLELVADLVTALDESEGVREAN